MAHLGEKLKAYRDQKDLTQPQMADYLSIGHRTYQTIEKTGDVKLVADLKKIFNVIEWDTQMLAQIGEKYSPSDGAATRRRSIKRLVPSKREPANPGQTPLIFHAPDRGCYHGLTKNKKPRTFRGCYSHRAKGAGLPMIKRAGKIRFPVIRYQLTPIWLLKNPRHFCRGYNLIMKKGTG